MINFSDISSRSFLGNSLRRMLNIIPSRWVMVVLQGPLKGARWIKGSGVNGYWLGSYELPKQKRFVSCIREGDVVWDIGAHVGFYTLLASRQAGPKGNVIAIEPLERNVGFLNRHCTLNKILNVKVIHAAAWDGNGFVHIDEGSGSFTGRVAEDSSSSGEVRAVSVDTLVKDGIPVPRVMKIDVEGAEARVLEGAAETLKKHHPVIFLATHGDEVKKRCMDILHGAGYRIEHFIPGAGDELIAST